MVGLSFSCFFIIIDILAFDTEDNRKEIFSQCYEGKSIHRTLSGRKIETNEEYLVETQEYQGGATAILQILKTQVIYLMFGYCHLQKLIF